MTERFLVLGFPETSYPLKLTFSNSDLCQRNGLKAVTSSRHTTATLYFLVSPGSSFFGLVLTTMKVCKK